MNKWVAAAFLIGFLFGLSLGKLSSNDNAAVSKNNTTSSTDALNLVEACARLNTAAQIYTRLTKERGAAYELLDTPGLSVLDNMVDLHADRTGFSSWDCLSFEGFPEVMAALQGKGESRKLLFKKGQMITGHTTQELPFSAGNIYGYRCIRPDGDFEFFLSREEMEAKRDHASTDCAPLTTARVPMQWDSHQKTSGRIKCTDFNEQQPDKYFDSPEEASDALWTGSWQCEDLAYDRTRDE